MVQMASIKREAFAEQMTELVSNVRIGPVDDEETYTCPYTDPYAHACACPRKCLYAFPSACPYAQVCTHAFTKLHTLHRSASYWRSAISWRCLRGMMANIVMSCILMAYMPMACIPMAYIIMPMQLWPTTFFSRQGHSRERACAPVCKEYCVPHSVIEMCTCMSV